VIIQMAGLPGTGKSALAAELIRQLPADTLLLDKDHVRHALFGPRNTSYTRAQDDFCVSVLFQTAAWHLNRRPGSVIILDGRTCSRPYQIHQVHQLAVSLGQSLRLIECTSPHTVAEQRLRTDLAAGDHPAENRDPTLYRQLKETATPIPEPKLVLDTTLPIRHCADQALNYCRCPDLVSPPASQQESV
jgi:predicted kinase